MPQLSNVPLSYPLYLDLGQHEARPNFDSIYEKPNMLDLNMFYENLFHNQNNGAGVLHSNFLTESFNYYLNQCRNEEKCLPGKSFSIESILGFKQKPAYQSDHYSPNSDCSYKDGQSGAENTIIGDPLFPATSTTKDVYSIKEKYCPDSTQPSPSRVMVNPKSYPGLTKKTKTLKAKTQSHFGSKSKRVRTIFTPEQLERLETEFERQQYMVGTGRLYLASTLNLTEAQVKVWFQNRRIKWRKQHLEGQADKDSILERDFDV